jgi:hypothetical protein
MRIWGNFLKKLLFLLLLMPLLLMAYSDSDFDGVADEHDLCPQSSMLDIVDKNGCRIEKLVVPTSNHFDLIFGLSRLKMATTNKSYLNESLQIDYYHNNLTLQLQSANYQKDGLGDTALSLFYRLNPTKDLSLTLGASLIFPTYDGDFDNNNIDYKLSTTLNYQWDMWSLFLGISHTIVNDDDINSSEYKILYQNAQNLYLGIGRYLSSKLYSSIIYSDNTGSYQGGEHLKNLSLYNHYMIDAHWFSRFGYLRGLNDSSSDQLYLNIGYYF